MNLFIFRDNLTLTHVLSKQLQNEEITLGGASNVIQGTIKTLKDKRTDKVVSLVWENISKFAEQHDICLQNPRSSKREKTRKHICLKDSVVMLTLGKDHNPETEEENQSEKSDCKSHVYNREFWTFTKRLYSS